MEDSRKGLYSGWFVILAGLFVTCLIVANIIAVKPIALPGGYATPAGIVIFPLSYLFGDVLTEVYGYGAARRVIWVGFACNLIAVAAIWIGGRLPGASFAGWAPGRQASYADILGFTPWLLLASFCAYLVGEFTNSFVLAKLKIATKGRWLWTRTIGSTFVGEGIDSIIFITIAFGLAQHVPAHALLRLIGAQWTLKVLYEVVATPFTYAVVGFLKRREGQDAYDTHTNFSPVVFSRATSIRTS
ncbi:MAG TPA: queuosine precursor transporter [Ktedonobacterales bacterium]|nr:queuosine precursor transporter [Ktedonobacterales bacterium]